MIFVDQDEVVRRVPADWLAAAAAAAAALVKETDPDKRASLLRLHGDVWRAVKAPLARLSREKCWYCEAREQRSDNAVDHYRPKGRLAGVPAHPGYWWLAFDIGNLRYSCTYCNSRRVDVEGGTSGGKQDYFPLEDEAKRASSPADVLEDEQPMLLDPCCASDVMLLWFDETGQVRQNPVTTWANANAKERVETSVRLFHLDYAPTVGARRLVYLHVQRQCKRGDAEFDAAVSGDEQARERLRAVFDDLARRTGPDAEFAATARCAIQGLRETSATAYQVARVM